MGIGVAGGENRAAEAAKAAISSPLLEASVEGATGILLNITGGARHGLFEVNEAAEIIGSAADSDANIIFGAVIDEAAGRPGARDGHRHRLRPQQPRPARSRVRRRRRREQPPRRPSRRPTHATPASSRCRPTHSRSRPSCATSSRPIIVRAVLAAAAVASVIAGAVATCAGAASCSAVSCSASALPRSALPAGRTGPGTPPSVSGTASRGGWRAATASRTSPSSDARANEYLGGGGLISLSAAGIALWMYSRQRPASPARA